MNTHSHTTEALQRLLDKDQIRDAICRYAQGVDRGNWTLVRSGYHADAFDAHGDYQGGVDGFINWLQRRFDGVDNSMHFLGQSLIEFAEPDVALVETYFVSRRLRPANEKEQASLNSGDAIAREGWGRYVDRFERRDDQWRVAHRTVVLEAVSSSVAKGGMRFSGALTWGDRNGNDRLDTLRAELFA